MKNMKQPTNSNRRDEIGTFQRYPFVSFPFCFLNELLILFVCFNFQIIVRLKLNLHKIQLNERIKSFRGFTRTKN